MTLQLCRFVFNVPFSVTRTCSFVDTQETLFIFWLHSLFLDFSDGEKTHHTFLALYLCFLKNIRIRLDLSHISSHLTFPADIAASLYAKQRVTVATRRFAPDTWSRMVSIGVSSGVCWPCFFICILFFPSFLLTFKRLFYSLDTHRPSRQCAAENHRGSPATRSLVAP